MQRRAGNRAVAAREENRSSGERTAIRPRYTECETVATRKCNSRRTVSVTLTLMLASAMRSSAPLFLPCTRYPPGRRRGKLNLPSPSDTADSIAPVPTFVSRICALGKRAPLGSIDTPVSAPVADVWQFGRGGTASAITNNTKAETDHCR